MLVELGVVESVIRRCWRCWRVRRWSMRPAGLGWPARRCTPGWGCMPAGGAAWRIRVPGRCRARIRWPRWWRPGSWRCAGSIRVWGPRTILYWLGMEGCDPLPGRTSVERCLIRHGLVIVGGVRLVDRSEAKIVSERLPARGGKPDQSGRLVTTSSAGIGAARHADGRQDADPSNGSPKGKTPPSAATSQ